MKHITQNLESELAKALSLIVAASHAAAREALDEAFGNTHGGRNRDGGGGQPHQRGTKSRSSSPRRSGAKIAELEGQFLGAVIAAPGEAMGVLAQRLGLSPQALQVPVARLKAAGRIKTVGSRQFTRYFPLERSNAERQDAGA